MAVEKITFELGSKFSGEGFEKANKLIEKNRKELEGGKRGVGELTAAFQQLDPQLAQATGGIGRFADAFIQGGIVGGLITAAMMAIGEAVKFVHKKFEEAKEATIAYANILKDRVLSAATENTKAFSELKGEMDDVEREAKEMLEVLNGTLAEEAKQAVAQLHVETLQKITDDMSETGKAMVLAHENYNKTMIQQNAAVGQCENAVEAYTKMLESATTRREAAEKHVVDQEVVLAATQEKSNEYLEKRRLLQQNLAVLEERYEDGLVSQQDILKHRKAFALKLQETEETYKGDVERLNKATEALETAKRNLKAEIEKEKTASNKLALAKEKLETATIERTSAENDARRALEDATEAEVAATNELIEKEEEAAQKFEELVESMKPVPQTIEELDADLKEMQDMIDDAFNEGDRALGIGGGGGGGGAAGGGGGGAAGGGGGININGGGGGGININGGGGGGININGGGGGGININGGGGGGIKIGGAVINNKPTKLDQGTWDRIQNGTANLADRDRAARFAERDERDRQSELNRLQGDFNNYVKNKDKPASHLSDLDKRQIQQMEDVVIPNMNPNEAADMLQRAGDQTLTSNESEEFLDDEDAVLEYVQKLSTDAVVEAVKAQTNAINAALTVR